MVGAPVLEGGTGGDDSGAGVGTTLAGTTRRLARSRLRPTRRTSECRPGSSGAISRRRRRPWRVARRTYVWPTKLIRTPARLGSPRAATRSDVPGAATAGDTVSRGLALVPRLSAGAPDTGAAAKAA